MLGSGLRECVGEPRHDLRVGANAWTRNVVVGTNLIADGGTISTRDAHEFIPAQFAWIATNAALGAAKWKTHKTALERHDHGQTLHLIQRDMWMKSQAALVWTKRVVVLNAIAGEQAMLAIIHEHWKVNHDFILGLRQHKLMRTAHASELRGGQRLLQDLVE